MPAPAPPEPVTKTTVLTKVHEYEKPVLNVMALALAFVIALLALRSLRAPAEAPAEQTAQPQPALAAAPAGAPGGELPRAIPDRAIAAPAGMRERVVASVEEQPEVAARLLKSWMKE
jgi:flagellar biosynthesis/type III secretory pathway M-ring protein FliF/YscJ